MRRVQARLPLDRLRWSADERESTLRADNGAERHRGQAEAPALRPLAEVASVWDMGQGSCGWPAAQLRGVRHEGIDF